MSIIFSQVIARHNGVLALNMGTGAPVDPIPSQGLLLDEDGQIYATDTTPPSHYYAGLPFDADGRLIVEAESVAYYDQGLPFTANHALAGGEDGTGGYYNQGVFFTAGGAVVMSGLAIAPEQVQNLQLSAGDTVIDATWDAVTANPAVTNYRVEYREVGAPTWTTQDPGNVTSYQITGLTNSQTYEVRVAAQNAAGFGPYSSVETAQPVAPPAAPTTWGALPQNLNNADFSGQAILAIDTDENGTWVAVGENGAASISTDDGASWSALPQGLNSGGLATDTLYDVKTNRQGTWIAVADNAESAISTDNGATWSALPQGLNSGTTAERTTSVGSNGASTWVVAFVSGYAAISTDDGTSWSALPRYFNSAYTGTIPWRLGTDENGRWIAAISLRLDFMAISDDDGLTWTAYTPPDPQIGTVDSLSTHGGTWLSTSQGNTSSRSADNGDSWADVVFGGVTSDRFYSGDTDRFGRWVAVGQDGLARLNETDGTGAWSSLALYLNSGAAAGEDIRAVASSGERGVWMAGLQNGYAAISPPL